MRAENDGITKVITPDKGTTLDIMNAKKCKKTNCPRLLALLYACRLKTTISTLPELEPITRSSLTIKPPSAGTVQPFYPEYGIDDTITEVGCLNLPQICCMDRTITIQFIQSLFHYYNGCAKAPTSWG